MAAHSNFAMEQTEEYVDDQLKTKYGMVLSGETMVRAVCWSLESLRLLPQSVLRLFTL
jgi:hypothetical protein